MNRITAVIIAVIALAMGTYLFLGSGADSTAEVPSDAGEASEPAVTPAE